MQQLQEAHAQIAQLQAEATLFEDRWFAVNFTKAANESRIKHLEADLVELRQHVAQAEAAAKDAYLKGRREEREIWVGDED